MTLQERLKNLKSVFVKPEEEVSFLERMQSVVIETQLNTAAGKDIEWSHILKLREDELIREYETKLAVKTAELDQYIRLISDLQLQKENQQKGYQMYYEDMLLTNKIASDVYHHVKRLLDSSGEIYQSIVSVRDAMKTHSERVNKKDSQVREMMGMKNIPSSERPLLVNKKEK
jgi:hypothetical protein